MDENDDCKAMMNVRLTAMMVVMKLTMMLMVRTTGSCWCNAQLVA